MKTPKSLRTSGSGNPKMGLQDWGLIVILSVLWGGSFFFVGVAVKEMPPLTIVLCRVALAYIIYFRVLATAGPTNLLLVTFLIPLSAILLGVIFLNEQLGWNAFAGMGLIFAGLVIIDGRLLQRFNRQADVRPDEI